ncbi:hypothetical protein [Brevundimonas viscosa]|uniref:hypothetical protein n=1 Tax=Brevundimonas viscosa TaxID=871741 RepID=UPI001FEA538B|nr:hypothetical protein [Brevundimonas viscosa]
MASILRLLPGMLALALASAALPARGEPYTADHMLRSESFGAVRITPDERHVLFERRGPYESAERFDLGFLGSWSASEAWIAEPDAPERARPLLDEPDRRGVVLGAFSPSGRRMVVHRLTRERWETGVAELAAGEEVHWLGVGAEPPVKGETTIWRSDEELILVVRTDGDLPYEIGALARAMAQTERRRRITAGGGVAATVWGAGAFAEPRSPSAATTVLRVDLRTGERTILAEGQTQDIALSPDGRWLALLDRGPPVAVDPDVPLRPGDAPEERRLSILDLATGATWSACNGCDVASGLLSWSEDARLLVWARDPSRKPTAGRLLIVDPGERRVETGDLGRLLPEVGETRDASFETVRAAWMGDAPIILAREVEGGRADWRRLEADGPINLTRGLPEPPGPLEAVWSDGLIVVADGAAWAVDDQGRIGRLEAPDRVSSISTLTHWASPRLRLNTPPQRRWTVARAADGSLWRLDVNGSARRIARSAASVRAVAESLAVDRVVANGVETLRLLTPGHPPPTTDDAQPELCRRRLRRTPARDHARRPGGVRGKLAVRPEGRSAAGDARNHYSLSRRIGASPGEPGGVLRHGQRPTVGGTGLCGAHSRPAADRPGRSGRASHRADRRHARRGAGPIPQPRW